MGAFFRKKSIDHKPSDPPAFRLCGLNRIEFGNVDWGYFQWFEFYIEHSAKLGSFRDLFPYLKDSDFFRKSKACSGWTEPSKDREHADAWYGRYVFRSLSDSDYTPLTYDEFLNRLGLYVAAQEQHRLDYGRGFGTTIQPLYKEILSLINKVIAPEIAFYELTIDEEQDKQKVSTISIGIWEYFKSFVGFDSTANRVYRIEMGRD